VVVKQETPSLANPWKSLICDLQYFENLLLGVKEYNPLRNFSEGIGNSLQISHICQKVVKKTFNILPGSIDFLLEQLPSQTR
jgi:hypothetical protein